MPLGGLLIAGGAGAVAGGLFGYLGDMKQADAAEQARLQNAGIIQDQANDRNIAATAASGLLYGAVPGVQENMLQGYEAGADFATQGFGQQRSDLLQSGDLGVGAINQGLGASTDALYGGAGQGISALMGRQDRAGGMLDQAGGLYGNYQADPGYEFRRKAGEDAIRNMQAARGGRFGGAAMKELVDYNQNAASQEFGNYVNRANSEFGARTSSDAQALNATSQAANMAYGAGQGAAGLYGNAAAQQADIYGRTGTQLGTQAATAGQTLGNQAQNYYGGLANLDMDVAKTVGGNLMNAANAGAATLPVQLANNSSTVPYAGSGMTAAGNIATGLGNTAVMAGAMSGGGSGPAATGTTAYNPAAMEGTAEFIGPSSALANPQGLTQAPAGASGLYGDLQATSTAVDPAILSRMGYQQPASSPIDPAILTRMGVR